MRGPLALSVAVLMLASRCALAQSAAPARDPKPSDCLSEEKGIRPPKTPGNAAWKYFEILTEIRNKLRSEATR